MSRDDIALLRALQFGISERGKNGKAGIGYFCQEETRAGFFLVEIPRGSRAERDGGSAPFPFAPGDQRARRKSSSARVEPSLAPASPPSSSGTMPVASALPSSTPH